MSSKREHDLPNLANLRSFGFLGARSNTIHRPRPEGSLKGNARSWQPSSSIPSTLTNQGRTIPLNDETNHIVVGEAGRRWAILLANCTKLTSALIDSIQLSRMLVSKGYRPESIFPIIIDPPQTDLWFKADYPPGVHPQRVMNVRELWATLRRIYRSVDPSSPSTRGVVDPSSPSTRGVVDPSGRGSTHELLFVLSSHGGTGLPNPKEADGFDEYIVVNGTIVKDDELHDRVVGDLPDNITLTLLTDTCHSGTMFDLPREWTPGETSRVVCISACRDDQSAFDAIGSKYGKVGGLVNVALKCLDQRGVEGLRLDFLIEEAKRSFGDKQAIEVTMV